MLAVDDVADLDASEKFRGTRAGGIAGDDAADLLLCRDPMAAALEELLRYDSPVLHSTFRYATEPVEIGDVRFRPARR
jgi:cytochrome P450